MAPSRIEYAHREHRSAIAAIEARAFGPLGREHLRSVARCRRSPGVRLVALAEDGEVLGYVASAWFHQRPAVRGERSLFVLALAVDELHRRHGIGRQLLRTLFERGSARGARLYRLQVELENARATALYLSLGFEARERIKDSYGTGKDGLVMERPARASDGPARA